MPCDRSLELSYLLLFHRFEDLDDALLVVDNIDTLKYFTIFASAHLSDDFIVVLVPADQRNVSVIPTMMQTGYETALTPTQ